MQLCALNPCVCVSVYPAGQTRVAGTKHDTPYKEVLDGQEAVVVAPKAFIHVAVLLTSVKRDGHTGDVLHEFGVGDV